MIVRPRLYIGLRLPRHRALRPPLGRPRRARRRHRPPGAARAELSAPTAETDGTETTLQPGATAERRLVAVAQIHPAEALLAESLKFAQGLAALGANRRVMGSMKGRTKVRKMSSWPRSWANFRLLQPYSHRDAWANLRLLGRPNTFHAEGPRGARHPRSGPSGAFKRP